MSGGQHQRPRVFSLGSHKSHKSQKSNVSATYHGDMHETSAEKNKKVIKSKADPMMAMTEEQPSMVATGESNLGSIRAMQHKDLNGNPILDPDRSNPTRSRWERPLDTIKAFEAAIDSEYKRQSVARGDSQVGLASRRSSYHNGLSNGFNTPARMGPDSGYHSGRPSPSNMRSEYHNESYYGEPAPAPRNRLAQRMTPEPAYNGYNAPSQSVYPSHGYHQSHETVNSGNGSHVTEPWGNSTDPSSDNSSIDRAHPAARYDHNEQYAGNGYSGADTLGAPAVKYGYGTNVQSPLSPPQGPPQARYNDQGYAADAGSSAPPALPPKDPSPPQRTPIKLGSPAVGSSGNNAGSSGARPVAQERRKSWFKRFSKG